MTDAVPDRSIGTLAAAARLRIAADSLLGVKTDPRIIKLSTLTVDPRITVLDSTPKAPRRTNSLKTPSAKKLKENDTPTVVVRLVKDLPGIGKKGQSVDINESIAQAILIPGGFATHVAAKGAVATGKPLKGARAGSKFGKVTVTDGEIIVADRKITVSDGKFIVTKGNVVYGTPPQVDSEITRETYGYKK